MSDQYTLRTRGGIVLMGNGGGNKLHLGVSGSVSTFCGMGRLHDRSPVVFYSRESAEDFLSKLDRDALCSKCTRHHKLLDFEVVR